MDFRVGAIQRLDLDLVAPQTVIAKGKLPTGGHIYIELVYLYCMSACLLQEVIIWKCLAVLASKMIDG